MILEKQENRQEKETRPTTDSDLRHKGQKWGKREIETRGAILKREKCHGVWEMKCVINQSVAWEETSVENKSF